MAKTTNVELPNRVRGKSLYPWRTWSDGQTWELERGVDYTIKSSAMVNSAHTYARNNNLSARTHIIATGLLLKFSPREQADVQQPQRASKPIRKPKPRRGVWK